MQDELNRQLEAEEKEIRRIAGRRIRELRKSLGLTSVDLADMAGISQGQLSPAVQDAVQKCILIHTFPRLSFREKL